MSVGHLVGKAPSLHVMITTPASEFWRGRLEENITPVLRNESPCVSWQASRMLAKHQPSLSFCCLHMSGHYILRRFLQGEVTLEAALARALSAPLKQRRESIALWVFGLCSLDL